MKNIKQYIILLFLLLSFYNHNIAQSNLVLNPSFEVYDTCPLPENGTIFIIYTPPWYSPQEGTPDLFNECSNLGNGVPYTAYGFRYPRTGKGFGGFVWDYSSNCEYLTGRFSSPLVNGKKYCVEFYVSFTEYSYFAYDRIGAYISVDSLHFSGGAYGYLHFIPQVENPAGNIITDTVNWTLISGEYIAKGGEQFITIGNFRPDSLVQTLIRDTVHAYYPYYYLDDVSVTLCDSTGGVNEIGGNKSNFNIFPNPASEEIQVISNQCSVISAEIFNLFGEKVYTSPFTDYRTPLTINVANFPCGVYVVRIETGNEVIVRKFIKE